MRCSSGTSYDSLVNRELSGSNELGVCLLGIAQSIFFSIFCVSFTIYQAGSTLNIWRAFGVFFPTAANRNLGNVVACDTRIHFLRGEERQQCINELMIEYEPWEL